VRRIGQALRDWAIWIYIYGHPWTWIVVVVVAVIIAFALAASVQDCRQKGVPFYECGVGSP